jgi:hypothetical protein
MVGRPSLQNPSISRLTLPHETIPSCYRRRRHTEFQPHSRRHPPDASNHNIIEEALPAIPRLGATLRVMGTPRPPSPSDPASINGTSGKPPEGPTSVKRK